MKHLEFISKYCNLRPRSADFLQIVLKLANPTKVETVWRLSRGCCLDAGCGIGKYFPFFRAEMLVGLDINAQRLREIKDEWKEVHFIVGDVRTLPFRDNLFDCITAIEVIEHLPRKDREKLVSEFKRIARNRAHIIITTPNLSAPFALMYPLLFKIGDMIERFLLRRSFPQIYSDKFDVHLSYYTTRDLANLGFWVYGIGDLGGGILSIDRFWTKNPLLRKLINGFLYNNPMFASHLLGVLVTET